MIWQNIREAWEAAPGWIKTVLTLALGAVVFILESATDDEDDQLSEASETEQLDLLREKLYFDSDGDVTYGLTSERYLPGGK